MLGELDAYLDQVDIMGPHWHSLGDPEPLVLEDVAALCASDTIICDGSRHIDKALDFSDG